MKLALFKSCLTICSCFLISACSSMLPLRTYTSAAVKGLSALEEIDYSFLQQCEANCRDRDLAASRINRLPCDCADSRSADSVNMLIYQSISAYLSSLEKLSAPGLAKMPVKAFTGSLANTNIIKITEKQLSAYQTLSELMSSALTSNYRGRKVKLYIARAHEPLVTLVDALRLNLDNNLSGTIEVRKQRLRADYYELLNQKGLSAYEKKRITEDYYLSIEHLDRHKENLKRFAEILSEIKTGHEALYKGLDHLSDEELQRRVSLQAVKIEALMKAIDKTS